MAGALTVGSAFAGIGGFELGLERAGLVPRWSIEKEPFRQRVLARHFPNTVIHDDIRTATGDRHNLKVYGGDGAYSTWLPHVDLFAAGVPCQPTSYAGLGLGADDERWLWPDALRLVRELRPRWVVLENPTALLTRGLDWVLGELAAIGLDAEWDCVPASAIGAPHQRDRVWIVAYPDASRQPERGEHDGGALGPRQQAPLGHDAGGLRSDVADADESGRAWRPRIFGEGWRRQLEDRRQQDRWWKAEPAVGRVVDGLPGRVDRLAALGDSLVHVIPELIGRRILEWEGLAA